LEVVLATGDGRVVRGGGRLVKNVTGYDLPRLATGSLGSLGLIASVCLKLWPLTAERAMFEVSDPAAAMRAAYRPYAIIETETKATVYVAGTAAEIEAQASRIGGHPVSGHRWPDPLRGLFDLLVRVPAGAVADGVSRIRQEGWRFQAAHGVGEIRLAVDDHDAAAVLSLRQWAESVGGGLVAVRVPEGSDLDPWGLPPDSLDLQRRVKAAFDPIGVANPGKLPGGI
jgi:glycolate oxidase FAD binding subunit